jgi:hypothetical protein
MDAMFEDYSRRLDDFAPGREQQNLLVSLFARREDYLNYTTNKFPNTGGVFLPAKNALAAFLEGQGRDALRRTLQHEAFHQFAFTAIHADLPVWINEGLAQVFEEGIWTGRGFLLGQVPPRRVRQLQADVRGGRLTSFDKFMKLGNDEWARNLAGDADRGATQYNQAWAMVHFLVYSPDARSKYRQRFLEMLKQIHAGRSPEGAFVDSFSSNIEGFQDRFIESAESLTATPEATMIERQEVLADLLVELKNHGMTFTEMPSFREATSAGGYRLTYTKGRINWKTDADARVYFSNPAGQVLNSSELFFETNRSAPLPDIVCRYDSRLQLRTRFYPSSDKIEHEVRVEAR